jgi:hypothetical protein
MLKCSRKPFFWAFLVIFIASVLALPGLLSRDSVEYYFNQFSDNGNSNDKASTWFPWSSSNKTMNDSKTECSLPLNVYMYDIPRKYNMGLLGKDEPNQELPWTNPVAPPWNFEFEVNKQHSVEYWLMVYLLNARDSKDGKMAAVRVNDPKQADVFFVPFFSARSFNNYGHNMLDPEAEIDKGLQVRAFSFLTSHLFWCCFVCMTRAADNIIA